MKFCCVLLERLTTNAKVATILGLIQASSGTVESEGAADKAVLNIVHELNIHVLR
jgi:hypothetical protein